MSEILLHSCDELLLDWEIFYSPPLKNIDHVELLEAFRNAMNMIITGNFKKYRYEGDSNNVLVINLHDSVGELVSNFFFNRPRLRSLLFNELASCHRRRFMVIEVLITKIFNTLHE